MLDRLYYVFFQKPSRGKTERHLLGRFMTHGNNLRIIEDYHDQLADSLSEGPMDLHSLQLMDRLKENPYIKVISQQQVDQDPEFAEFASGEKHPEAEAPKTIGGSIFEYHQHGVATPQIIEFRGGVPHLNNTALSPEEIAAIKHNVTNGIGKIVHKENSLQKSIQKMEGVFKKLIKRDDDDEPHHEDVTAAFNFLRNLIETHPEAAKHERTLARLVFQDSMVPKVGSKYAHKDFLSRPRDGIHVVLDGNDFKSINDTHGHPVGDIAIKAYGKALREAVDEAGDGKGKAFRMGGDEFAVHMPTPEHASRFGRIMREKLDAIPPIGGTHKLSMAMGFGQTIHDADKALYMAKEQKLHPETKQPLYPKGQAPTMAHSLMPGHEGPIPLSPEMPSMNVSGLKPPPLKMPEPESAKGLAKLNPSHESLYTPYNEELEKSEKLPHYLKFMGKHPKAQETAEWADNNIKHRNLAEFAMRHAQTKPEGLSHEEKAHIQHFHDSLHMAEVQKAAGSLTSKHDFNSGLQILKDAEGEYLKRHAATAPKLVPHEGQKVIDLGDGVAVYDLPLNNERKNPNEAVALGHCGTPHMGGQVWSIRKDHGNGNAEPLVTISHEGGYFGEIKGKGNWKPSTKFHPYLAKLMASDLVKGFVGGGYAPESNFEFSDMKEGLRKKLLDYKPSLKQKVYKEELPEGFQGNYSHAPEVKSIFKSNDVQAQIDYLSKHPPGSEVHESAAGHENITPEVLKYLIDKNKAGSLVHAYAAGNENIHPEVLKYLIDRNQADSRVHEHAAGNKNIHPEVLKYLIDKNKAGSGVHQWAAGNENITPELLKYLIDRNQADSRVHTHAALNKNITPELLKYLVENNKAGSDVHTAAAGHENITPELLKYLVENNKAGSDVHTAAALNENIHPEVLKYLIDKNQAGSDVHYHAALNKNIHPEVLKYLIDRNQADSRVHTAAAEHKNIHPEVLKYLIDRNQADSRVHTAAAEHKNIHPEALKHLIDKNQADSDVHRLAAGNENIHPEVLKYLIDRNQADSRVHEHAAGNKNIHPDVLKYLIDKNKAGSGVHQWAAGNKNITPELLKYLIDRNQADSRVHTHAAGNKNIHPDVLKYLVEKNQAGSGVHQWAAGNKNITPELLKYLVENNKAGSFVHENAAENKNITPELLKYLIDKNQAGSPVHQYAALNPQFKNLPPETQMLFRPYMKENMQKLISIMNDEENPEAAVVAHKELKARRKEKYDRILSHEGSTEDLLHYAESHDEDVSKRAREELRRRNLIKAEHSSESDPLSSKK